jgi:hypothetical protein
MTANIIWNLGDRTTVRLPRDLSAHSGDATTRLNPTTPAGQLWERVSEGVMLTQRDDVKLGIAAGSKFRQHA